MANQFIGKTKFKVPKKPLNIAKKPGSGKTAAQKAAEKAAKKKKQLEALSGILGAASDLTRGGGGGGVGSSSNTDFGRAPIPTGHTEEDFWHPETTENGSPNDNG